jgi:predicted KAP-like P-loop ATPase
MKHLLCILSLAMMASCTKSETQESKAVAHIYKPVYTDNFKISDPKNVLLIDQMHKTLIAKDFKGAFEMLDDSVVFQLGTGQTLKGKPAVMDYMEKGFYENRMYKKDAVHLSQLPDDFVPREYVRLNPDLHGMDN